MSDSISHTTCIRVRYSEVDKMGFLHHSRYLSYFEIGRTELLRRSGFTYREFEEQNLFLVVVKINVAYKAPIKYDDIVNVTTTAKRITPARIDHAYEIRNESSSIVHATAESTLACVDGHGTLSRIPDFLLNLTYDVSPS